MKTLNEFKKEFSNYLIDKQLKITFMKTLESNSTATIVGTDKKNFPDKELRAIWDQIKGKQCTIKYFDESVNSYLVEVDKEYNFGSTKKPNLHNTVFISAENLQS